MHLSVTLLFFVIGTIFGSFYNVVGYRLPRGESIIYPPSHCIKCKHKLSVLELIPILSYLFLGGKCKKCKNKISAFYPLFEFISGVLFSLSYVVYGFSIECLICIIFVSMLIIIIISDYQTMIIPDSVLIVSTILILILKFFTLNMNGVLISILNAVLSFTFMFLLKKIGDFLFKKESLGGGDIKLLFVFGLMFGFPMSIICVFLSAFIALPISLIFLRRSVTHEIPYGPFLALSAIIIVMFKIDINFVINLLTI